MALFRTRFLLVLSDAPQEPVVGVSPHVRVRAREGEDSGKIPPHKEIDVWGYKGDFVPVLSLYRATSNRRHPSPPGEGGGEPFGLITFEQRSRLGRPNMGYSHVGLSLKNPLMFSRKVRAPLPVAHKLAFALSDRPSWPVLFWATGDPACKKRLCQAIDQPPEKSNDSERI